MPVFEVRARGSTAGPLAPIPMPVLLDTIHASIAAHAERVPDAIAIETPGRSPLTFACLHQHMLATVAALRREGIERNDCVAIVLPHSAELATACLAVGAGAAVAPLNPEYRRAEFEFHLASLAPKVLLVAAGRETPARDVARALSIRVLEIAAVDGAGAGVFRFPSAGGATAATVDLAPAADLAQPDDVALMLHTSGTTSRPKKVPLTQRNLIASVANLARSLGLTPEDRCLHLIPMYHIGGLLDVLAAPLCVGGRVICTPGFSVPAFYRGLAASRPTWSQAVPTMLQEILGCADDHRDIVLGHTLRFMRSVSAPLPAPLLAAFEQRFRVPVIEIYGMTETAGVITSNPFPDGMRKSASVGIAAGPEVAVMDEAGSARAPMDRGEIVVRGDNVMRGYADGDADRGAEFFGTWFRTGDEGYLDHDHHLFLTGRIKEIINRGGEKVSPREVDDALLAHPAIAEAATFAVPHPTLGEEVAAVVVLKEGATVAKSELIDHLGARLAYFKVPRILHFAAAIPRTAGGKLQRHLMAEAFGLSGPAGAASRAPYAAPQTRVARALVAIWERALGAERIGVDDDFFELGGSSLKAASFVNQIEQDWGATVYVTAVFDAPTVARFEACLHRDYPEVVARMLGREASRDAAARHRVSAGDAARFRDSIALTLRSGPMRDGPKNPPAVFILSPPRSGSTLLRAMLGGSSALFSPPELYLLSFETLADRQAWFTGAQRFQLEGNTRALMQLRDLNVDAADAMMREFEERRLPVRDYYRTLQDWLGPRRLVDKTPYYAARIETLERAEAYFDGALYVHLLRHPHGMIRSLDEAKLDQFWYPRLVGVDEAERTPSPWPREAFAELLWLALHRNILAFLERVPPERKFRLRFEDLVTAPAQATGGLCRFLGIPFEPAMLEPQRDPRQRMTDGIHPESRMIGDMKFHRHRTIDPAVADRWRHELRSDLLSDETWELAATLGYERTSTGQAERTVLEI